MADASLTWQATTLSLSGPLTYATVQGLLLSLDRQALAERELDIVDLSAVSRVDSAGLALLVELWRLRQHHPAAAGLRFVGLPADIRPMLALYDLEDILL